MAFKKAEKKGLLARVAITGPTGSGKTWTALEIAKVLQGDKRTAFIDTENASSDRYADVFDFDNEYLNECAPENYVHLLRSVSPATHGVVIVDSLSHAWANGKGGALDMLNEAARDVRGNTYAAWKEITPEHNKLVNALLSMPTHLITCMRSKMDYVLEDDNGKKVPRKVGMGPIQRDGMEYEMDIVLDMDINHNATITKSRFRELPTSVKHPGKEFALQLKAALGEAVVSDTWKMTKEDMEQLISTGKSKDEIKALSSKMYGKTVPELNREEYTGLLAQLTGAI